ncbi:MAG: hypothetical protein CBB87_05130 [Micavibrio sp. TMED27]|nr:hypothetical protein [Micavibrio sp.]OUT91411.1 MAG: hypothetical protein CBB87_05130 [Micavibrio sp. TMED27]
MHADPTRAENAQNTLFLTHFLKRSFRRVTLEQFPDKQGINREYFYFMDACKVSNRRYSQLQDILFKNNREITEN